MNEAGETQRLLGELVASVRNLNDQLALGRIERKEGEERIREEVRNLKHEQRSREQVMSGKIELLEAHYRTQELKLSGFSSDLGAMREQIEAVRGPVQQLITIKDRIGSFVGLATILFVFVSGVLGQIINAGVGRLIGFLWK